MEEWAYPYAMADYFCLNNSCNGFVPAASTPCVDITKFWAGQPPDKYLFFELNAAGVSGVGGWIPTLPLGVPLRWKHFGTSAHSQSTWPLITGTPMRKVCTTIPIRTARRTNGKLTTRCSWLGMGTTRNSMKIIGLCGTRGRLCGVKTGISASGGQKARTRRSRVGSPNVQTWSFQVCGTFGCLNDVTFPIVYKADPIKPFGYWNKNK